MITPALPVPRALISFVPRPISNIQIDRDRTGTYGVSTTKLESLLRAAYSQNYVYLIKNAGRPISGHRRGRRSRRAPARKIFAKFYVKPDNGNTMIPIRAVTKAQENLGLQSVNHLNQFTSVTFGFDTKPDVALGDVINYIQKSAAEVLPPTVTGELQGEGLVLQQLFRALPFLDHRSSVRDVCHPRYSLRELRASSYRAVHSCSRRSSVA